jgi:hypothetical protein
MALSFIARETNARFLRIRPEGTMKIAALVGLVGSGFLAFPADADVYLKAYKQTKARGGNDWTLLNAYFMGVGSGYGYANTELRAKNESPFFCVPKNLALDAQNYIDILDAEIEEGNSRTTSLLTIFCYWDCGSRFPANDRSANRHGRGRLSIGSRRPWRQTISLVPGRESTATWGCDDGGR